MPSTGAKVRRDAEFYKRVLDAKKKA